MYVPELSRVVLCMVLDHTLVSADADGVVFVVGDRQLLVG